MGAYGGAEDAVPPWPADDFDSLYVLRLTRRAGGAPAITFASRPEGLNGRLPATCPAAYPAAYPESGAAAGAGAPPSQ
jgi:hypothetical protein